MLEEMWRNLAKINVILVQHIRLSIHKKQLDFFLKAKIIYL